MIQNRANPTLIGAFVLSALLLGLFAIFYLGADGLSDRGVRFILYFQGDVKGLQVGAPVTLRGVKVGQVEGMSIAYREQTQGFEIPVIVNIDLSKLGFETLQEPAAGRQLLDDMIERGLRARLNLQSLLTGKLEVELDFHPATPVRLVGKSREYPEIPTIPSSMEKLASALEGLPLERMVQRLTEILDALEQTFSATDIPALANNLATVMQHLETISIHLEETLPEITRGSTELLDESNAMLNGLDRSLGPMIQEWTRLAEASRRLLDQLNSGLPATLQDLDQTLASGRAAMQQVRNSAASMDSVLREDSPVMNELLGALQELAAAARSIRIMAEYLERHPNALLRGKQ